MPLALPAASTIPTGSSTLDILLASNSTSLMTVPSILEELYLTSDGAGINAMRMLRFVAVGGAPMKLSVAEALTRAGVPLLNHWGTTELGAIAPIFVPNIDYDWHYLRIRDDMELRFERVEGDAEHYRLIGRVPGTNEEFVVQDLLEVNPRRPHAEFRIAGRADDLIVLATGEKVRPTQLEHHVSQDPLVRGAVVFGNAKFQLGLLIEVVSHYSLDLTSPAAVSAYIDHIWPSVARGNEETDKHGRVSREMILLTTPETIPLIRTPKGSVPRNVNVQLFQDRIDDLYARADAVGVDALPVDDLAQLQDYVQRLVLESFSSSRALTDTDDFFEHGMDSLQATMLRRRLASAMRLTSPSAPALSLDIVYGNSTVLSLSNALFRIYHDKVEPSQDRLTKLRLTMEEWVKKVSSLAGYAISLPSVSSPCSEGAVVLLTGSTGNLGSAMLSVLASSPNVAKIYALNRASHRPLHCRQEEGLRKVGVELGQQWQKVELHEVDLSVEQFGLDDSVYARLRDVTHIIHNGKCTKRFTPHHFPNDICATSLAHGLQPLSVFLQPTSRGDAKHHSPRV
jgi:hypothetical protein